MGYVWHVDSPLGRILLASEEGALTGLWFEGQDHEGEGLTGDEEEKELSVFQNTEAWLAAYFSGKNPGALPPLSFKGTQFQKRVWNYLLAIPYGETRTYGQLAALYAKEYGLEHMSAQAVGGAVGKNPISILVPCHRVMGSDGSMTGYAGGVHRKEWLLKLERESLSQGVHREGAS